MTAIAAAKFDKRIRRGRDRSGGGDDDEYLEDPSYTRVHEPFKTDKLCCKTFDMVSFSLMVIYILVGSSCDTDSDCDREDLSVLSLLAGPAVSVLPFLVFVVVVVLKKNKENLLSKR